MPDLLPVSLTEMLAEMERDLLARRRLYHNRTFTRRLTHEKAERRIAIIAAIIELLRDQMPPGQLEAFAAAKQKKAQRRQSSPKRVQPARMGG